jgi:aminodeoxychorismate lyase
MSNFVYMNGRFVPEEGAHIPVRDRGFLYGDGVFETVRAYGGEPFLWRDHMKRFDRGCATLRLASPLSAGEMFRVCRELLQRNHAKDSLIRITLTRGTGGRGYSPKGADHPTFLMTCISPPTGLPPAYRVILSSLQLPARDPLASFKHANKLRQILARLEADEAGADEALLLDTRGCVIEGTASNLFWVQNKTVFTPPPGGILEGSTRSHIIRLCEKLGMPLKEQDIRPTRLLQADGIFLTSAGIEIMEVSHVDNKPVKRSRAVRQMQRHYRASETSRIKKRK